MIEASHSSQKNFLKIRSQIPELLCNKIRTIIVPVLSRYGKHSLKKFLDPGRDPESHIPPVQQLYQNSSTFWAILLTGKPT